MDIKTLVLLEQISSSTMEGCPCNCPNIKNLPKDQGCGLDVCMDQINLIIRQEMKACKTP